MSLRFAALALVGFAAAAAAAGSSRRSLCGPGTVYDGKADLCVLPGRHARAGHSSIHAAEPATAGPSSGNGMGVDPVPDSGGDPGAQFGPTGAPGAGGASGANPVGSGSGVSGGIPPTAISQITPPPGINTPSPPAPQTPAATADPAAPAATAAPVAPGTHPKIVDTDSNLDVQLPNSNSFTVSCPGDGKVACFGDAVTVNADGVCVPKTDILTKERTLALIADALADGLKTFRANAREVTDGPTGARQRQIAAFADSVSKADAVGGEVDALVKETEEFSSEASSQLDKISIKIDEAGSAAVDAISDETAKVEDDIAEVRGELDSYFAEVDKCTKAGAIGYDAKKKACVGASVDGYKSCYEMYLENQKTGTEHLLTDGIYTILVKDGPYLGGSNSGSAKNLRPCHGECDADSQCAAGLKCFQRSKGEPIPGCIGVGASPSDDYCYNPDKTAAVNKQLRPVRVWCDFQARYGESTPGWTLVSVISRYSRKHMVGEAYGTLSNLGPQQQKPWKLSNYDINSIKFANDLLPGKPPSAFKFGCGKVADRNEHRGQNFKGYQYFTRKCNFNANRRVDNYDNRICHDWAATETMTKYVTGYADSNDCGLGGHAGGGTLASYGWHYCSSNGRRTSLWQNTEYENIQGSSSTGCGHNDGYSRAGMNAGDGELWVK